MAYPTTNISTTGLTLPNITLTEQIRSLLNDPLPGVVVNNTQLLDMINRSANIMTKEGKCQEIETLSVALSTSISEYNYATCALSSTTANLIDHVVDIEAVIYTASVLGSVDAPGITAKALFQIDQLKLARLDQNTAGPPLYWCDTGKSIRIWPIPTASEGGAGSQHMLTILHYRSANSLKESSKGVPDNDTGTTYTVPNHMREYSIWYVLAESWGRKGRPDIAQFFKALFDKFVMYHRQDRMNKTVASLEDDKMADYTQYT